MSRYISRDISHHDRSVCESVFCFLCMCLQLCDSVNVCVYRRVLGVFLVTLKSYDNMPCLLFSFFKWSQPTIVRIREGWLQRKGWCEISSEKPRIWLEEWDCRARRAVEATSVPVLLIHTCTYVVTSRSPNAEHRPQHMTWCSMETRYSELWTLNSGEPSPHLGLL
jgi:hypothetical protein